MKRDGQHYVLSTGKRFYAHGGILGLGDNETTLYEGYDGTVTEADPVFDYHDEEDRARRFTDAERREIAQHMIAMWKKWAGAEAP